MDADIRLDGTTTTAEGFVFKTTANDVVVDAPGRRSSAAGQRRALVHDFTDGLTLNWDRDYPGGVTIEGFRLKANVADLMLDHAPRRKNDRPHRRALVHDFTDGLTINWAHDYPGGVTINGPVQLTGAVHVTGSLVVDNPFLGTVEVGEIFKRYHGLIEELSQRLTKLEG